MTSQAATSITFPALTLHDGFVDLIRSLDQLRYSSRLTIKKGTYKDALFVDCRGNAFRIAEVRKLRTVPPKFSVGELLGFLSGNPDLEVECVFTPADPATLSLNDVKALILDSFKERRSFWQEMLDLHDFKEAVRKAYSLEALVSTFEEFNGVRLA
jgi:hypothetical protein